MNKIKFLSLLIGLLTFSNASAVEIYNRTMSNPGPNGYNNVHKSSFDVLLPIPFLSPRLWIGMTYTDIGCSDPGFSQCPTSISNENTSYDLVDANNVNMLVGFADSQISNGTLSGSNTSSVMVQGEDFTRIYEVIWVTSSSGSISTKVTRIDVEI